MQFGGKSHFKSFRENHGKMNGWLLSCEAFTVILEQPLDHGLPNTGPAPWVGTKVQRLQEETQPSESKLRRILSELTPSLHHVYAFCWETVCFLLSLLRRAQSGPLMGHNQPQGIRLHELGVLFP